MRLKLRRATRFAQHFVEFIAKNETQNLIPVHSGKTSPIFFKFKDCHTKSPQLTISKIKGNREPPIKEDTLRLRSPSLMM